LREFNEAQQYPFCEICNRQVRSGDFDQEINILRSNRGDILLVCHSGCDPKEFFTVDRMKNSSALLYGMDFIVDGQSFRCINFPAGGRAQLINDSGRVVERELNELSMDIDGEVVRISNTTS